MMNEFTNYTDEELIGEFRKGKQQVQEYLLEKYKPFVKSKCRVLFLVGGDREDLIQEGMIGLFKAIRDFDPDKGVPFSSFAKLCVERQLYTAIEAATRQKNAPLNAYISLSEETDSLMDGGIEEAVVERASYQQTYARVRTQLSPMEKEVLALYLEGKDYTEIARILGKSDKSIDNALQRIKAKIRKIME